MKSYMEMAANIAAVEKIGQWIAQSQMFGQMTTAQGCVIASHCFLTETPLLEYQRRNMLIGNRPGIPYDAMVAAFQEAGGEIVVVEKSPSAARLKLVYKGKETAFGLTWEEAKQEPFCYGKRGVGEAEILAILKTGDEKAIAAILKPKYASPRSRAVMLWARCVSDAIRTVCPAANFGQYTLEEIEDIGTDGPSPAALSVAKQTTPPAVASTPKPTAAPAVATVPPAAVCSPPSTIDPTPEELPPGDDTGTQIDVDGPATDAQRVTALELLNELEATVPDIKGKLKAKLAASGVVGGIRGLSIAEAEKLINALRVKAIGEFFVENLKGHNGPKA